MNLEILRIWQETQKTVLFVTHGIQEAGIPGGRGHCLQRPAGPHGGGHRGEFAAPRTMEIKAEREFGKLCLEIYRLLEENELKCRNAEWRMRNGKKDSPWAFRILRKGKNEKGSVEQ